MAGHSKFKNIMHRKGAQDKKRAKVFSRLGREISVAVKVGGEDIESNTRLRSAIASAKSLNMPKDNIERVLKRLNESIASRVAGSNLLGASIALRLVECAQLAPRAAALVLTDVRVAVGPAVVVEAAGR